MAALTASRKIVTAGLPLKALRKVPVDAAAVMFHGGMVGKNSGYAEPAKTTSDKVIGVANLTRWDDKNTQGAASTIGGTSGEKVDNTLGLAGARHIMVEIGVVKFANKAGDLVDETMIGDDCFVENDQTVRATAAGTIVAGKVYGIDDDGGVFVEVGEQ